MYLMGIDDKAMFAWLRILLFLFIIETKKILRTQMNRHYSFIFRGSCFQSTTEEPVAFYSRHYRLFVDYSSAHDVEFWISVNSEF